MKPLRILLVDDQRMFVESMRVVLESSELSVDDVHVAQDGERALATLARYPIDIVLLDVHMPNVDGLQVLRHIRSHHADVPVIMLSAFGYDEYVRNALAEGARGYLLKDESPSLVVSAIRQVLEGGMVISEQTVRDVVAGSVDRDASPKSAPEWLSYLNEKERKILYLISLGQDNHEIARDTNLSYQTVRNYVSSIYHKLGITNRFKAMRMAIEGRIGEYVIET
jgi:DNA-binding NarL/FixJ family response regulator